jgi:hypothetical protein
VPIQTPSPVLDTVVITRQHADDLATAAFLRVLSRADRPVNEVVNGPVGRLAA